MEIPVPQLHFSKNSRGRLVVGTEVYSGSCLEDLDKFVPKDLTPRMVLRRKASFFNLAGKFSPILAGQSLLYRETAKVSEGWDVPISMDLRQNFKLKEDGHSCHLVIGRSLLGNEDSSIPKEELESLTMASNLCWVVRQALERFVESYILIGDSQIALCWISSEKKRLSLFHRNRVVQIKRGTDLEYCYHVKTEENPCDLGT